MPSQLDGPILKFLLPYMPETKSIIASLIQITTAHLLKSNKLNVRYSQSGPVGYRLDLHTVGSGSTPTRGNAAMNDHLKNMCTLYEHVRTAYDKN